MVKKFIKRASHPMRNLNNRFPFLSTLLLIVWVSGAIYIAKPVFEMIEAIPTYLESNNLKNNSEYLGKIRQTRNEMNNSGIQARTNIRGGLRLGKYDSGFRTGMNQHQNRAFNSKKYIEKGFTRIVYYLITLFLIPFILIRILS